MINEKEIDVLIEDIESLEKNHSNLGAYEMEIDEEERDLIIDALVLYKEMNTH